MTTNSVAGADPKVITVTGSSPAKPATKPLVSAQIGQSTGLPIESSVTAQPQEHSASLPTAIGVGIGVPLGVATSGILGFLFRKEAVRQRRSKLQILRQESIRGNEDPAPRNSYCRTSGRVSRYSTTERIGRYW